MEGIVSLVLDGLIVALLAGTIFYASRLSLHLKVFRESRQELEQLIGKLGQQTEVAHSAIDGMRETARQSGRDLQQLINESKALTDELEIMTEAGNNMANRLERNAETAARGQGGDVEAAPTRSRKPISDVASASVTDTQGNAGFMIRDRELDEEPAAAANNTSADGLQSQAEKELFEALQARKKTDAGGVS